MVSRLEVLGLANSGFFVRTGFLSLAEVGSLLERGAKRPLGRAKVGAVRRTDEELRTDRTCWIEQSDEPHLHLRFQQLGSELQEAARVVLELREVQLAHYAFGSFYGPHFDCAPGRAGRRMTAVCYLSDLSSEANGGQLRIFPVSSEPPVLIAPKRGLLVCFRSDAVRHEVLPCAKDRFSLTAWYH